MVAEEESHMKSEAMLLSLEWRFSRGRFMTPALLGYDRVAVPDGHGGFRKVLRINEDEAETVRLMYYMLLNGKTTQEIADTLTDLGRETGLKKVCGKVNTVWSASSVATVNAQRALLRRRPRKKDLDARLPYAQVCEEHREKEPLLSARPPRRHHHPGPVERGTAHPEQQGISVTAAAICPCESSTTVP